MQRLISTTDLRGILEHGLLGGLWSIADFNRTGRNPTLPSREFLEEHEEFYDINFRDMEAYNSRHHNVRL